MGSILTMAMKDLRLMARDRIGLFFIVIFPVMMAVLFGSMYGSFDTESVSLNVAVVDEDNSEMSRRFVESLEATGNVQVEQLDRQAALDRVRRGQSVGMIALPQGFGETAGIMWMEGPAIEVGVDPSRKAESGMLEGIVMQSMGKLVAARFQDPASMRPFVQQSSHEIVAANDISPRMRPALLQMMGSLDEFMETWESVRAADSDESGNASDAPEFRLARIETVDVTNDPEPGSTGALVRKLRSQWDVSFPQAMLWGILACAAGFAITIVRERKQGTFLRLQVAPITRGQILAGKALACWLSVISVIVLMVALGMWLGMRPRSFGLLALAAASVACCFVGIMILMSVIGKTEEAVSGAAWGANMLMAMFGGGMIPLVFMPAFMRSLSDFSPAKWSVLALEGAIWRGYTLAEMLWPCGLLLAIGAVCLTIGTFVLSRSTN